MFGTLSTSRFPFSMREWELPRLMEKMFGPEEEWWIHEGFAPRMNLAETDGAFEATIELPGLKPEEVKVEIHGGVLKVSGEKKEEKEEKGKTWHRVERRTGSFLRTLPLPSPVDETKVEARFEEGVLKVIVPKTEESKPRRIEVK